MQVAHRVRHLGPDLTRPQAVRKGTRALPVGGKDSFHCLEEAPHKLHVLLRHRLLRQPHRFEGLRVIPEELLVDDPALAHRRDACELHVRLRAMADAAPGEPCDDSIGHVDEADHFKGVSVPGLAHLHELAHEPLPAHERPRLRPTFRGSRDDIGVLQLTKGIHVSRVPRFEGGSHYLHVLPRHRVAVSPSLRSRRERLAPRAPLP